MRQPAWLPTSIEARYDAESRALIVENQCPDIGRIRRIPARPHRHENCRSDCTNGATRPDAQRRL
jgi:hypothetical protein